MLTIKDIEKLHLNMFNNIWENINKNNNFNDYINNLLKSKFIINKSKKHDIGLLNHKIFLKNYFLSNTVKL